MQTSYPSTGVMATAYHLEALRKQRILERARKSREQIEIEVLYVVISYDTIYNESADYFVHDPRAGELLVINCSD